MTDPIDAALDVWHHGYWPFYLQTEPASWIAEQRARMRRVLDARKRAVAFADKALENSGGGVHSEEEMYAAMDATEKEVGMVLTSAPLSDLAPGWSLTSLTRDPDDGRWCCSLSRGTDGVSGYGDGPGPAFDEAIATAAEMDRAAIEAAGE